VRPGDRVPLQRPHPRLRARGGLRHAAGRRPALRGEVLVRPEPRRWQALEDPVPGRARRGPARPRHPRRRDRPRDARAARRARPVRGLPRPAPLDDPRRHLRERRPAARLRRDGVPHPGRRRAPGVEPDRPRADVPESAACRARTRRSRRPRRGRQPRDRPAPHRAARERGSGRALPDRCGGRARAEGRRPRRPRRPRALRRGPPGVARRRDPRAPARVPRRYALLRERPRRGHHGRRSARARARAPGGPHAAARRAERADRLSAARRQAAEPRVQPGDRGRDARPRADRECGARAGGALAARRAQREPLPLADRERVRPDHDRRTGASATRARRSSASSATDRTSSSAGRCGR
jgi:hypothetical protein